MYFCYRLADEEWRRANRGAESYRQRCGRVRARQTPDVCILIPGNSLVKMNNYAWRRARIRAGLHAGLKTRGDHLEWSAPELVARWL